MNCRLGDGQLAKDFHLIGGLGVNERSVQGFPTLGRMAIDNNKIILSLTHDGGEIQRVGNDWFLEIDLYDASHSFRPRLPGRGILHRLALWWPMAHGTENPWVGNRWTDSQIRLFVVSDDEILDQGISRLAALATDEKIDGLSPSPFQGRTLVRALINQIY